MRKHGTTVRQLMVLVLLVASGLGLYKHPTTDHFAIIGQIDMNRDGKDDRAELRRMIEEAGGVVDFDYPPPEIGTPTGKLSARTNWYICDAPVPLSDDNWTSIRRERFNRSVGQYVKEARIAGARPMPLSKLLDSSGTLEPVHR